MRGGRRSRATNEQSEQVDVLGGCFAGRAGTCAWFRECVVGSLFLAASGLSDCVLEPKSTHRHSAADQFMLVFSSSQRVDGLGPAAAAEVPSMTLLPSLVSGGAQRRNTA